MNRLIIGDIITNSWSNDRFGFIYRCFSRENVCPLRAKVPFLPPRASDGLSSCPLPHPPCPRVSGHRQWQTDRSKTPWAQRLSRPGWNHFAPRVKDPFTLGYAGGDGRPPTKCTCVRPECKPLCADDGYAAPAGCRGLRQRRRQRRVRCVSAAGSRLCWWQS